MQALGYLMSVGDDDTALAAAIDCAVASNDQSLQDTLVFRAESDGNTNLFLFCAFVFFKCPLGFMHFVAHMLGDSDGIPKDPKHLFRLYLLLRRHREAAKIALIIAADEQQRGVLEQYECVEYTQHRPVPERTSGSVRHAARVA